MKDNKKLKLILLIITSIILIILIKQNVTATKEIPVDPKESTTALNLEINSELVKNVYNKLILLNDRIIDDEIYRYSYFNLENNQHELTEEEKLYIAFESLYKKDKLIKEELEEGVEILKTTPGEIKNEILELFRDENFDSLNLNYKPSLNCGIIDYLYTGQEYELKYKKCPIEKQDKSKIESAVKDGDFIHLTIASFYTEKNDDNDYSVKNYNDDKTIINVDYSTLTNNTDEIFNNKEINRYVFSFELKGDNYYLFSIKKK